MGPALFSKFKGRAIVIVLDSVGAGQMHDSSQYGDEGANTLGNIGQRVGLRLPNLMKMGLGNIVFIKGTPPVVEPSGAFGLMNEVSPGKDTSTGHWEMAGIELAHPFPTYTHTGFPARVREKFEALTGKEAIWLATYSGTEILQDFGKEHVATGKPIVYTSADSVFQVAAHEQHYSIKTAKGEFKGVDALYETCRIARDEVLQGDHAVGRVIARPFVGESPESFKRTANRHDYALFPTDPTILDALSGAGLDVIGVGKIKDIFAGKGVTQSVYNKGSRCKVVSVGGEIVEIERTDPSGIDNTIDFLGRDFNGLLFVNLVDSDMLFGHRRDICGYRENLVMFDSRLPRILAAMKEDDLLFITADHGCDPTHHGTDHTRECVPLLVWGQKIKMGVDIGSRKSFADLAATLGELFEVDYHGHGLSFASSLL